MKLFLSNFFNWFISSAPLFKNKFRMNVYSITPVGNRRVKGLKLQEIKIPGKGAGDLVGLNIPCYLTNVTVPINSCFLFR